MTKIKQIINQINADKRIAQKDADISTSTEDHAYYNGIFDGLNIAKQHVLGEEID